MMKPLSPADAVDMRQALAPDSTEPFYVFSRGQSNPVILWLRPDGTHLTMNINDAGKFTAAAAARIIAEHLQADGIAMRVSDVERAVTFRRIVTLRDGDNERLFKSAAGGPIGKVTFSRATIIPAPDVSGE